MPPAVTVVGSLNADLVVTVAHLPGRGETVVGTSTETGAGGKGANQAAAAAALCDDIAMVGRVGDDSVGRRLVGDLAGRGVRTSDVQVTGDGVPTGTATVAVEAATGENLIIVAPGANGAVEPADVEIPAVRDADVVLAQLEIPLAAVSAAVAHASGRVVLNPAPPTELPPELLAQVDVLVPNEWELARLAGSDSKEGTTDEIARLARTVTRGDVVVTLGARGALVVPADGDATLIAPPQVEVVDTTGAGDCFCGALCVALARGKPLVDAANYAVTAAALSTTGRGARGTLPDDAAVRAAMTRTP